MDQASLIETFARESHAASAAFPEKLSNLVVYFGARQIYAAPRVAAHLARHAGDLNKVLGHASLIMMFSPAVGLADEKKVAGLPVRFVMLDKCVSSGDIREDLAVLQHEIGHLVVKNGLPSLWNFYDRSLTESAAEAYAALRLLQMFPGTDTEEFLRRRVNNRAAQVLSGNPSQYTSNAIERVIAVAREHDISGLPLRDTAQLAEMVAQETRMKKSDLKRISKAFSSAVNLEGIAAVTRRYAADPAIATAGQRMMSLDEFMQKKLESRLGSRQMLGFRS